MARRAGQPSSPRRRAESARLRYRSLADRRGQPESRPRCRFETRAVAAAPRSEGVPGEHRRLPGDVPIFRRTQDVGELTLAIASRREAVPPPPDRPRRDRPPGRESGRNSSPRSAGEGRSASRPSAPPVGDFQVSAEPQDGRRREPRAWAVEPCRHPRSRVADRNAEDVRVVGGFDLHPLGATGVVGVDRGVCDRLADRSRWLRERLRAALEIALTPARQPRPTRARARTNTPASTGLVPQPPASAPRWTS